MAFDQVLKDARKAKRLFSSKTKVENEGSTANVVKLNLGAASAGSRTAAADGVAAFLHDATKRREAAINDHGQTSVGFSFRQATDTLPAPNQVLEEGTMSGDGRSIRVAADMYSGSSGMALMLRHDDAGMDSFFTYDLLDVMALQIIDMVIQTGATVSTLTRYQLSVLYRYFYRSNPIIAQIIDTHTDLLMSKARIVPPENVPEILRDYCTKFTKDWIKKSNFEIQLRNNHRGTNIYGYSYMVFDDDTSKLKNQLQPLGRVSQDYAQLNEDDQKFVAETEKLYATDPKKVPLKDRLRYLDIKCLNKLENDYTGPDRCLVYNPLDINKEHRNLETGYEGIFVGVSTEAISAPDQQALKTHGYTKGWIDLIEDAKGNNQNDLLIDNNPHNSLPFLAVMERPERTSLIHRVLHDAFLYDVGRRAEMVNLLMFGKIGRIYKAPNASPDQIIALEDQIYELHADPTYVIVTNFDLSVEEVGVRTKDQATELAGNQEKNNNTISTALGLPMSFISNESQYSGANITLEVINVVYNSQKDYIVNTMNEKVFKPISMRKGLVTLDEWGDLIVVAPQLAFTRMALRDDSVTSNLFNLYTKGSLPVEIIYEIFNLDTSEIERSLRKDAFTLRDSTFNDLMRDVYNSVSASIATSDEIVKKICDSLGIKKVELMPADSGMGGGAGGGDDFGMGGDLGGGLPGSGDIGPGGEAPDGANPEVPTNPDDLGTNVQDVPTDNFTPN